MRSAPGYDDWLPHDLLHFVVGGNARTLIPADQRLVAKTWRKARIKKIRLAEGRRSEALAGELERGWRSRTAEPALLAKLDGLATKWHSLRTGGSLTLEWPHPERRR